MRRAVSLLALVAVVAVSCGGDSSGPPVTSAEYTAFRNQPTACGGSAPSEAQAMAFDAPEDQGLTGTVRVRLDTSCGPITLDLFSEVAPQAVNSFVFLARAGYFDGTVFHRIVPGFVIQGGDPTAAGTGNPGYRLPDELPPEGFAYSPGVVAMANSGPDSAGSQFFIVVADIQLPATFTVFGGFVDGADAIAAILAVPLAVNSRGERSVPLETVYIESVTVEG
ncbi:MAG TPA: peptidylprolyl isomerase [Acidimicrobiia bacterium]|nr:peptidylprolyl isomerase [Acidimicrobiia bacterium]